VASDRYADGSRLTATLTEWQKRWRTETTPPSCAALLTRAEEQRLCVEATELLTQVKARAEALDRTNDTLRDAAELSRRAARATQKLRYRDMEYMGTQGLSLAAPSASTGAAAVPNGAGRPASSAQARPSAKPSGSGAADTEAPAGTRRDDPYQALVRAYAKLEVEAVRYLGAFLELGPLPTRKRAFGEITALWEEASRPSPTLQQVVRQAALLESDPELKASLKKLDRKSHLVPPTPSAR
jgi:hypothetical protein